MYLMGTKKYKTPLALLNQGFDRESVRDTHKYPCRSMIDLLND